MIEKLRKLGLTGYEAQAFVALLKLGDAEASEIAAKAKIPMGRIYSVLSNLEELRLIHAQNTRPRKYVCVESSTALDRLLKNKQEELKREGEEIGAMANNMASELAGLRISRSAKTFWTVAIGEEKSRELVREYISGSKKELLFFMAPKMTSERIKKDLMREERLDILNVLYTTIRKGVEIKVILNKDVDFSLVEDHPVVKRLLKHMGNGLNCRLAAIPATPFDIIDRENILLQMLNPLAPDEIFAVVNIRDTKLAEELRKKFFTIWEKAEAYTGKDESYFKKNAKVP